MEVNTEKVFFICEINSNVSYYRNENYASVFHVAVNDIKSHKKLLLLRTHVLFSESESRKKLNFDKSFCLGDHEIVFNTETKLALYLPEYSRRE